MELKRSRKSRVDFNNRRIAGMNGNPRNSCTLGLIVALSIGGWGLPFAIGGQSEMTEHPRHSSEESLLNVNTLIGNPVIDNTGKQLGTVKDLLIDQASGHIAYIILAYGGTFGGIFGIGVENYSIPWNEVVLIKKDTKMLVQVADAAMGKTGTKHEKVSGDNQIASRGGGKGFDSATVGTLEGTVENVDKELLSPGVGLMDSLVVLDVKTASGEERVHVGPDDYLKQQGIEIKKGDTVEVTGSRITRDGENLFLASNIILKENGNVLILRQKDGTPKWKQGKGINTKSKTRNE
jgi:sporulation protein YlmC with PRC-barrel domain